MKKSRCGSFALFGRSFLFHSSTVSFNTLHYIHTHAYVDVDTLQWSQSTRIQNIIRSFNRKNCIIDKWILIGLFSMPLCRKALFDAWTERDQLCVFVCLCKSVCLWLCVCQSIAFYFAGNWIFFSLPARYSSLNLSRSLAHPRHGVCIAVMFIIRFKSQGNTKTTARNCIVCRQWREKKRGCTNSIRCRAENHLREKNQQFTSFFLLSPNNLLWLKNWHRKIANERI